MDNIQRHFDDYLVIKNNDLINIISQTVDIMEKRNLTRRVYPEIKEDSVKEENPPKKADNVKEPEKSSYMNVQGVAKYISLSAPTIYKYVRDDTIPYRKKGKKLLFDKREIDEWLNS